MQKVNKVNNDLNLKHLYELDEYLWLQETIKLLKANRLQDLDLENLIEELENLSRRDKAKVASLLEQIIRHIILLQYWQEESTHNSGHWKAEIRSFRNQLKRRLTTNLYQYLEHELPFIYQDALEYVLDKTEGKISDLPLNCPWGLEQLLDINHLPEKV